MLLADGSSKPIEDIQLGDLVLATDPETGETAAEEVTDLIPGAGMKDLVRIGADPDHDGQIDWITATDGHPFYVAARGWTDAGDLTTGDLLVSDDGTAFEILQLDTSTRIAVVHNLTVDRIHTYYVLAGNQSTLVHNCHGNSLASPRTTYLYRLTGQNGYIKTGVTGNLNRRYSKWYLKDKKLAVLTSGSRRDMVRLERRIVEWGPGPKNRERWAGIKWR